MKIYIAGKISGDKNYKRKFKKVEKKLKRKNHSVMNPAWIVSFPEFDRKNYMAVSKVMQKQCSATLFLSDWEDSKGARIEYENAKKLGQSIFFNIKDVQKVSKK